MSLRYEQYAALKSTRKFLRQILIMPSKTKISELRKSASFCLRHFPLLNEHGKPFFSKDDFTTQDGNQK